MQSQIASLAVKLSLALPPDPTFNQRRSYTYKLLHICCKYRHQMHPDATTPGVNPMNNRLFLRVSE